MSYENKIAQNAWRRKHPEISRRWRKNHLDQNRLIHRINDAKRRFGLTLRQATKLRKRACEICGKKAKKMCIDHKIPKTYRGVLCQQCNTRLGWLEHHFRVIFSYLRRGPQNASRK